MGDWIDCTGKASEVVNRLSAAWDFCRDQSGKKKVKGLAWYLFGQWRIHFFLPPCCRFVFSLGS